MQATAEKPTRHNINTTIGTTVSVSRTANALKNGSLNLKVDEMSSPFDKIVADYKATEHQLKSGKVSFTTTHKVNGKSERVSGERDMTLNERAGAEQVLARLAPSYAEAVSKRAALSAVRYRGSRENGVILSIVTDRIANELLLHAMRAAVADETTMVRIGHIHAPGVEKLSTYPLYSGLALFRETGKKLELEATSKKHADELKKACKEAVKEAVKELRAKNEVHAKKAKKDETAPATPAEPAPAATPATPAPAPTPTAAEEDAADSKKSRFAHYVNEVRKLLLEKYPELKVKDKNKDKSMKVAGDAVAYIADIINCFIHRLGPVAIELALANENKTVTKDTILRAIKLFMIDGHAPDDQVVVEDVMVPDPEALKAEEAKQAAEKKEGRKYEFDREALPKVPGHRAKRDIRYPTSGYDELVAEIDTKLALIPPPQKKSKDEPEHHEDVLPVPAVVAPVAVQPIAN